MKVYTHRVKESSGNQKDEFDYLLMREWEKIMIKTIISLMCICTIVMYCMCVGAGKDDTRNGRK